MRKFGLAPRSKWLLTGNVSHQQRARILGRTTFATIVSRLTEAASISCFTCESMDEDKNYARIELVLAVDDPAIIDAWHNSRGGCRAQYYLDARLGVAAERYAIRGLQNVFETRLKRHPKWKLFRASLVDQHAKLRIYPGKWIHLSPEADRKLRVPEWARHWQAKVRGRLTKEEKHIRKLARWGALIPDRETRLLLKGGWMHKITHRSLGRRARDKENRPQEFHCYGFS